MLSILLHSDKGGEKKRKEKKKYVRNTYRRDQRYILSCFDRGAVFAVLYVPTSPSDIT